MSHPTGGPPPPRGGVVLPNGEWCDAEPQPARAKLLGLVPQASGWWQVTIIDPVSDRQTLPRGA